MDGGGELMDDEKAPLTNDSNELDSENDFEDEELEEMHKAMQERDKALKNMSKFEKKLIKGLMRGFVNTMILWLISKKRQHGYEIMTKLHESTPYDNKMPSASKIYPVLHDLEKNGLINGSWEHHGKRKVKYYEITDDGKATLSRFRKMANFARTHKPSIWLEFMRDMMAHEDNRS
jgi:DNA-binding PadR family transcriptional regulator